MATTEKQRYYPTSQQPQIFQPADAPQQTAVEQPKANIFANWGQNGQGNWARTSNPSASQWADRTMKDMNIGQKTNETPIVVPYEAGTRVVQQPVVQQQTQTTPVQSVQQPIRSMDDLAAAMGYTSPEEEERMRKASVANQRIVAVADALRQIGNIYNTTRYAPSQQFNSPVEAERQRYLQAKALRDRANQTYISYQQAKAKQEAQQRQWDREFELKKSEDARKEALNDARISRMYAQNENDGARKVYWDTRARLLEEGWPLEKALKEARAAQAQAAANLSNIKANQGGFAPKSGGGGKPTLWQTRYNDYDYANQNGIPVMEETTDFLGNKTTKRRDPNVVHAEVEEHKRDKGGTSSNNQARRNAVKRQSKTRI